MVIIFIVRNGIYFGRLKVGLGHLVFQVWGNEMMMSDEREEESGGIVDGSKRFFNFYQFDENTFDIMYYLRNFDG